MRRVLSALLVAIGMTTFVAPVGTSAASPCRVRNVDQGTSGGSLKAMAAAAVAGDRLRVRGVCRGEVVISADIRIRGIGKGAAVTGQDKRRAMRVRPGADATIRDLVVRDGLAPPASTLRGGGGIRNLGELSELLVSGSVIRRNRAVDGGGIHNLGEAEVVDSVIARDRADFGGGGIANVGPGSLDIATTTIARNTAGVEGGGIANHDGAALTFGVGVVFEANAPDDCIGSPAC